MSELLNKYDGLLDANGPAAMTLREWLKPVGDEVVFPPTYAGKQGEDSGYNLDQVGAQLVCTIDSVPSQANRIEPAFKTLAGGTLVPQVLIKTPKDGETVHLLDAGHRAADAVVRFSDLKEEISSALEARRKGNTEPLARLAPTSLVFGMWDSRGSGSKAPRLMTSVIRAWDVQKVTRSAQYFPALDYQEAGVVSEKGEKELSEEGMAEVPSVGKPGGVVVRGGIRRDASINLCTLKDIKAGDPDATLKLQRYLLGLTLVAFTHFDGKAFNLRQGCQLVLDQNNPRQVRKVRAEGTEEEFVLSSEEALAYASAVAKDFGVAGDRVATFLAEKAKGALKKEDKKKGKGKKEADEAVREGA